MIYTDCTKIMGYKILTDVVVEWLALFVFQRSQVQILAQRVRFCGGFPQSLQVYTFKISRDHFLSNPSFIIILPFNAV
jgi:hypothetical protein